MFFIFIETFPCDKRYGIIGTVRHHMALVEGKNMARILNRSKGCFFWAAVISVTYYCLLCSSTAMAAEKVHHTDLSALERSHVLPGHRPGSIFPASSSSGSLDLGEGIRESRTAGKPFLRPFILSLFNISDMDTFFPFSTSLSSSSFPHSSLFSWLGFRRLMDSFSESTEETEADLRFPGEPGSDLLCLAELLDTSMDFDYTGPVEGVTTPIYINRWVFGGVEYTDYFQEQRNRHMDCRLALALTRVGGVLKSLGVTQVIWSSAYRPPARQAREHGYEKHNLGIAIDIHGFVFAGNMRVMVADHYEKGLGFQRDHLCHGRPLTREGFLLRLIACRLDSSDLFAEILTPDYDAGHWNHFHMAVFHPLDRNRRRHKNTALIEVPLNSIPGWAMARPPRSDPERELWVETAKTPWPEDYEWLRENLKNRWTRWKEQNPHADPEIGLSGWWEKQEMGDNELEIPVEPDQVALHEALISAFFKRLTSIWN